MGSVGNAMSQTVMPDNPYAAPAAPVADSAPRQLELAGRGMRLGAVIVDGLVYGVATMPMTMAVLFVAGMANLKDTRNLGIAAGIAGGVGLLLFLGAIVGNCVLLHRNGQTIAKKLLGIRVVRRDGSRCGLARIFFARFLPVTFLGFIPFVGGLVSLVDALLIFRDDRRCLHDEIADTIVVVA